MGLFSFLFSKKKQFRSTYEAEIFRNAFREDEKLFLQVGQSDEIKRLLELGEQVNSSAFKQKRKEIEQLSYKGSECCKVESQYKALLKQRRLKSYLLIYNSKELSGYEQVKKTAEYQEFQRLKVIIQSVGFDKKLHAQEHEAYKAIVQKPKIAALIKFEKLKHFKGYCELKDTDLPQEFKKLTAFVKSEKFNQERRFLLDKHRYKTLDDYKLLQEYEALRKRPEVVKYNSLLNNAYFMGMQKWRLVFDDDFDKGRLDTANWITRYYAGEKFLNDTYGVGDDMQLYLSENITFRDSSICLNFRKEPIIGKYWDQKLGFREREYNYTSAMISSALSLQQKYGRFEAKVKLNHSSITSCFWMLSATDPVHIEVMKCESDGVRMGQKNKRNSVAKNDVQLLKNIDLANEYYIFTLEWTEEKMVWMINDLVVREIHENIPDIPMYIVFSLGANAVLSDKKLPTRMEIDWVKAYQLKR